MVKKKNCAATNEKTAKKVLKPTLVVSPRKPLFEVRLRKIEKPPSTNPEDELNWICQSLGFFERIDRGKTAASIFKEILKAAESEGPLTSTQLAQRIRMSRGAIINHLNNLMRSGLVVKDGRYYFARGRNITQIIDEIEADIEATLARIKKIARELDKEFEKL